MHLGLIGGIGVAATIVYYRRLTAALAKRSESRLDLTIVELLLRLGDSLGMIVVAEGVDTEEKLVMLRDLNCPRAQGFHIARPMSVEDATRWLRQQEALAASLR